MKGKIIVSVVCLVLVVGVVIGAVVVHHSNNNNSSKPQSSEQKPSDNSVVSRICQNTQDAKLCQEALSSVADSSDPKAYIAAAVKATTESVIKALNMTDRLTVDQGNKDAGIKMALDDCKDLLQSAMDSLSLTTNMVGDSNIKAVHDRSSDFRNWLSAVISYSQACTDNFDANKDGEKAVMEQLNTESLDNVGKITGVALDIVSDLSNLLSSFNLKLDLKPASRRLLALEVDNEGLPVWLSRSDRDLLEHLNVQMKVKKSGGKKGGKGKGKGKKAAAVAGAAAGSAAGAAAGSGVTYAGSIVPATPQAPNVVVAKDGSGQFRTVKEAIDSYPAGFKGRYVIYVKAGIYNEYIVVPKTAVNILMYGDGPTRTIITGNKNFANGVKTMNTATFANTASGFIAKSIRFENTAGPNGHQAVALRNQGDMSAFFDCHILGYQDTLYTQTNRQFYRNCEISGTIDFIFGVSPTLIQNSKIIVRKPNPNQFNTVTADGTSQQNMATGIVLQNCNIVAEPEFFPVRAQYKSYLGRPWKQFAKTVVMESVIDDFLHPEGWTPWAGSQFLDTLYYAEYANSGPGANTAGRIKWRGYHPSISTAEAAKFTASQFLKGGPTGTAEQWLSATGVPFTAGFTKA